MSGLDRRARALEAYARTGGQERDPILEEDDEEPEEITYEPNSGWYPTDSLRYDDGGMDISGAGLIRDGELVMWVELDSEDRDDTGPA